MSLELANYIEQDKGDCILWPLRNRKTVYLTVDDRKVLRRKRIKEPVLIIAELPCTEGPTLLFALPGHGCEAMPVTDLRAGTLVKVGISARSAKALISELVKLYEVPQSGKENSKTAKCKEEDTKT